MTNSTHGVARAAQTYAKASASEHAALLSAGAPPDAPTAMVTEDMALAGASVIDAWGEILDLPALAQKVYIAMVRAR